MKKILLCLTISLVISNLYGQGVTDSLKILKDNSVRESDFETERYMDSIEQDLRLLISDNHRVMDTLHGEFLKLKEHLGQLSEILALLELKSESNKSTIISVDNELSALNDNTLIIKNEVFSSLDTVLTELNSTRSKVEVVRSNSETGIKKTTQRLTYLFTIVGCAVFLFIVLYLLNRKKNNDVSGDLNTAVVDLELKINYAMVGFAENLEKTLSKLLDSRRIENAVEGPQDNRILIFDFAQQIANLENNIWTLPEGDRVRKRVERATKKMRDTCMSLGYEIPELLGSEVTENQIIEIKSRTENPDLNPGQIVIVRVLKPLILYNGKMEQRPIVDVQEKLEE